MKISVSETINDGNLGDTWKDNYKAAKAFAAYCEERYTAALRKAFGPKVELDIDVRANRNTSGTTFLNVDTNADDFGVQSRVERIVEDVRDQAYSEWCESAAAQQLSA